ncbi:MAG: hypothetical protein M3O50_14340 [Myxococcota bacterium]|nr:hypothetical protein [Myxococcota bacterium]
MRAAGLASWLLLAVLCVSVLGDCETKQPHPSTYFERAIAPVLQSSCVRTNTGAGCHVADVKGNAFGNLDLEDYGGVARRRDLLLDYGPYLQPSLLLKNVPSYGVSIQLWDGTKVDVTTDIKHTGGPILDPTGSAYRTIRRWLENGATEDNTGVPPVVIARKPCTSVVPSAPGFDPSTDPNSPDFATFRHLVAPVLETACAAGNCHGTAVNALYLTCGTTPEELRWNYFAAVEYLAATPEQSEIIRRPLATSQGGSYHEGGPLFASVNDPDYQRLSRWAQEHGAPQPASLDPAFLFFAQKVQPALVKKGCMMAQCHSAAMFHDYRLRGGSAGSFSLAATRRNYEISVGQMSFESDDVGASRLVRKNLYGRELSPAASGIAHRGGALLEDFNGRPASGDLCDQRGFDYDKAAVDGIPAYCVLREWHKRERAARHLAPLTAILYVKRPPPPPPDRAQDYDVFAGGASLRLARVTQSATGDVSVMTDGALDLSGCGLGTSSDIRRPAVSWDGKQIAFAGRVSAADPLAIYTAAADGSGCSKQPDIARHDPSANAILEHDFDPVFSPPGQVDGVQRIVFASTRGNLSSTAFDYSGPQRTPEDPTKPNANLYVLEPDPSAQANLRVRQLTWQLNLERFPSFMQDGRLMFSAEKREPGFYQLALRRQNLDGGDYHPLYAQRSSIGYEQATSVIELAHKDFAAIFSQHTAQHGAGALGIFNRSLGVDFTSLRPADYAVDPSVIDRTSPSSPEAPFFVHSLSTPVTDGSYASPTALPDGRILVSFGDGDPSTFGGDYDLYVFDPATGSKTRLLGDVGTAEVEAVGIYERVAKGIFTSTPDEPNGSTQIRSGEESSDVTILDMPVLASLLFQNTPTGRVVESSLKGFDIFEELPPDVTAFPGCGGSTACDQLGKDGKVYVRRRLLGNVPLQSDGSARFRVPGGLPIVLRLADDEESRKLKLPRWQREAMTFVPGEYAHQSMPGVFFDNVCAGCHGAISGRPLDAAMRPDFLTQASLVAAALAPAADFTGPPSTRGAISGAPAAQ